MATSMPMPLPTRAPEPAPQLVRHSHKPVWGTGALVRNAPTKRAYQFEDGRTRTFKKGFYHLLEAVDLPDGRAEKLAQQLITRASDRADAREVKAEAVPVDREHVQAHLSRQVALLLKDFPEGFTGDAWKKKHRSDSRRLKRHRDPVIQAGQELLSAEALDARLEAEDATGLRDAWLDLLSQTDLVTPARRRALKSAAVGQPWLETLRNVLHGDTAFPVRLERWIAENERCSPKTASWSLCLAPLALVHPAEHMVVRHSRMKHQMAWLRPGNPLPKRPGAPSYADLRKVIADLVQALTKAGHPPVDLFDVHDFIQLTTTTQAREALA